MPQERDILWTDFFKVDSLLGGYKSIMTLVMPIGF